MSKSIQIGCMFLLISMCVCSGIYSVQADDDTLRTEVDEKGLIFNKFSFKAWKGVGSGGEASENKETTSERIFYAESKEFDSQTVIVAESLKVKLHAGHYYALSTEVKSQGGVTYFDFIAALRTSKNRDVFEQYSNIDAWTTVTLLLNPVEDVIPLYFAIRLFGQGKVFAKHLSLTELTKEEFDQKRKLLVAEKTASAQKRIEKVFLPYTPSLPLPTIDSPQQFKIWGTAEEPYPPLPFGWRQVPGEQADIESVIADRLKSSEYLIYTRPTASPVYLESVPKTNELISGLSTQATPGEYTPLNFAIYSAKNLEGVRVRITDLTSDNNQVIKNTNIDIRTVNFTRKVKDNTKKTYYLMPLTLGKGPDWIDGNSSRRYWLTVFVPPTTEPGIYRGTINFEPDNASKNFIPIEFNVLPFTLLDPPIVRFLWGPPKSIHPDNESKIYQDMAMHGLSTMILSGEVKTRDQRIDKEDIDNINQSIDKGLNTHNTLSFQDLPIGGIHNNQIIYYWDKQLKWFRYWPITPELDSQFVSAYREVFTQSEQAEKRSNLLHYLVDEPGGANPKNLEPAMHYLKLFKKEFPKLKTFVTIGGGMKQGYDEIGMLSPYLDVTCTNYVTSEVIDRLEKVHSEFWIYNGSSLNVDPIKERFFFGWYAWKIGAKGVGQWTYAWTGFPFLSVFRDERQDYALETKNGYLPTVGLEMIRYGIDDYRSLYTLAKLIQDGLQSKDNTLNEKASNASTRLATIREKVNLNYLRGSDVPESNMVGITPENLDSFRGEVEQLIVGMVLESKTTWATLQKKLKDDPETLFRKPSEKDWQQSSPLQVTGKDLLAETRFGGMQSDWKIQIWKGTGEGKFDSGFQHQGNTTASLEITSTSEEDNGALVLHKPDILLKKGVRYRLSTWLKAENVKQSVFLFAAVRGGGVSDVESKRMSGSSDWKYLWLDFIPEEDCKAQYFAVRLRGQGIVYLDKVMLQPL